MTRSLPPLAAIRVFEAAARQLSFTKAAAELGMTQAAVSYQIKVLEERVGAALFNRGRRQVVLTDVGARLATDCTTALDLIAAAFNESQGDAHGVLAVTVTSTFAAYWLARHLVDFQRLHPRLVVQLTNSEQVLDLERDNVDVGIRAGKGDWPGLTCHKLIETAFTPMLSPALLERMGGVESPADLLRYPLIDPTDPWWNLWFASAGVTREGYEVDNGHKMGSQHLEAIAAMAGQGVAILTRFFYGEELARGQLVQPFDVAGEEGRAYYLVYPTARRNAPKIRAFREWLLGHFPAPEVATPPSLAEAG
ncbi:LysR substrate-binding domain-containing protein [Aureimonas sp. AU12]|uniref:LysR substrate-binding domain-containing protein n=1 Tax=Aureimonas sp. AU12 TaxID=1638161 RepID=UPI000783D522|nr:LysR substrate-binding domain-containing protein [Aureimonas sp. AU12]